MIGVKRKTYIYILFILTIMHVGCKFQLSVIEANKEYQKVLATYDEKYISHFPSELEKLPLYIKKDLTSAYDHPRLILNSCYTKRTIDTLYSFFNKNAIASYNVTDTSLLIVNKFTNSDNWSRERKAYNAEIQDYLEVTDEKKYPIPNFWNNPQRVDYTGCKLPEDFTLFVVDAKSGIYFPDSCLTDGRYMPESWKNGYSKGVAISRKKKEAIYWFIIW